MSHKLLVLVPYRKREKNLKGLLSVLPSYLANAGLDFHISVIEQANDYLFNRGTVFNIGMHIFNNSNYDYVCLHDVDMLPVDMDYSYSDKPTSLVYWVSQFPNGVIPYDWFFGGITIVTVRDYMIVNGFSNFYYGWGCEDDDFYMRLRNKDLPRERRKGRVYSQPHPVEHVDDGNPRKKQNRSLLYAVMGRKYDFSNDGFNQINKTIPYEFVAKEPVIENVTHYEVTWPEPYMWENLNDIHTWTLARSRQ